MKTYSKILLLAAVLAALIVPAAAQKSTSTSKAAPHKPTATGKKVASKHTASHAKTGKVATGEAASLAKETANGDRPAMIEENRGRVASARRAASHPGHVAKPTKHGQASTVASSRRKSATLQSTGQAHPKASLKTSQLTAGKASRTKTRNVSLPREVPGKGKKNSEKKAVVNPEKNQANKPSDQPALKSNNARMF
jgi:hypothetical protein